MPVIAGYDDQIFINCPFDAELAIKVIRDWLKNESKRKTLPGENILIRKYNDFKKTIPGICKRLGFDKSNIPFNDYCLIVEQGISSKS